MGWGGPEGQIIGLKKREREAAAHRRVLEQRIARIIGTMQRYRGNDPEGLMLVMGWAVKQLQRTLDGEEVQPLRRPKSGDHE
jgi:hypothetical protein